MVVADEMAGAVVERLELVEIAEDEREGMAVAVSARRFGLELSDERAPVGKLRQRIVVGAELQLLEARGRIERGRRLRREQAQRLQLLLGRQPPARRVAYP